MNRLSRRKAEAELRRVHAVMEPLERTMVEAVAGRGDMLEAAAAAAGLSEDEGLAVLRSGLNKLALLYAEDAAPADIKRGTVQ